MPNYTQIQLRRDTTTNWSTANPILAEGEFTYDITANKVKIGDGITNWNSLPYAELALSAYEVALNNGFVGTEQQWLNSLSQGLSAYGVAVANGFIGTEQEWLLSLNGKSAYELAVEYGFTNSEEDWVASLVWTDSFITVWDTENLSTGSSATKQIELPFVSTGNYNCLVDWGDGSTNSITVWNDPATTHTYTNAGIYTIRISGICQGFRFSNSRDRLKLLSILQWGKDLRDINFYGCSNLTIGANDIFNTYGMTSFQDCFRSCSSISQIPNINLWNVSNVTNMSYMFSSCTNFNQPLNNWNVSNVTNMLYMFYFCTNFNQPLNNWNVSNVTNMTHMFRDCINFNQPLDTWNVSNVTNMSYMFSGCTNFNQPLNNWNVSNVTNMINMFSGCTSYSIPNYSDLLIGWSALTLKSNVTFTGSPNGYNSTAITARANLISNFNWTITDGGLK